MVNERVERVGVEGGLPYEQLVQDDTQGPQVSCVVVGLLLNQLRGHVQGGAWRTGHAHDVQCTRERTSAHTNSRDARSMRA